MELNLFWVAMWRRWYLTLLGLAVALALTAFMFVKIGPTYKAEGTMLLFPPTSTTTSKGQIETQGNPYLQLGGLSQARDVVIRAFDAESAQEEFARQEPTAGYEMAPDYTTSGPLIIIDVSAPTPTAAVSGLQKVMKMVPRTLKSLQTGLDLPESAYITAVNLTADSKPEVVRSGQIRAGIVVAAVGMTLAFFLIGLLDGLLTTRAARSSHSAKHELPKRGASNAGDDEQSAGQLQPPSARSQSAGTAAATSSRSSRDATEQRQAQHASTGSR